MRAKIEGEVKFPDGITDCSEERSLTEEFLNATFGETLKIRITGRSVVDDHFSYRVEFERQEDFDELVANLTEQPAITILRAELER
ncbi:MAG: hypothetical protein EOO89_09575 [Pedobacter sp.]|nr:MAG: hypothetical protein EOO89_09575 [Pedobacter sp.]